MLIRTMWGATSPTNPMTPVKQMQPAVMREAAVTPHMRSLSTFTPRASADSSPVASRLKSHACRTSRGKGGRTMRAANPISRQPALDRLPKCQKVIS